MAKCSVEVTVAFQSGPLTPKRMPDWFLITSVCGASLFLGLCDGICNISGIFVPA